MSGSVSNWSISIQGLIQVNSIVSDSSYNPTSAMFDQATQLHRNGQLEQAELSYQAILRADPTHTESLHMLGCVALSRGQHQLAADLIGYAIKAAPESASAYSNLGIALKALGKLPGAVAAYKHSIALQPRMADTHYNLGIALHALNRPEDALESFDRAIALRPGHALSHNNRAAVLFDLDQPQQAVQGYREACRLAPADPQARWNLALALLKCGSYTEGWRLYEHGWASGHRGTPPSLSSQLWLGKQGLAGRSILLYSEQGFGDTIQFCRYASLVKGLGAHEVWLLVPQPLISLMHQGLAGVDHLICPTDAIPQTDFHAPLMSLPLALGTQIESVPATVPYLRVDPLRRAAWQQRLGAQSGPRIGLAWRGSAQHKNDRNRSMRVDQFLAGVPPHWDGVSLQLELLPHESGALQGHKNIRHFGSHLVDFAETAALIDCLDAVVCVDTSVAHLSGALGCPTALLLARSSDWRWLSSRDDSPWYPTTRLLRQGMDGDWGAVVRAVASTTHALLR